MYQQERALEAPDCQERLPGTGTGDLHAEQRWREASCAVLDGAHRFMRDILIRMAQISPCHCRREYNTTQTARIRAGNGSIRPEGCGCVWHCSSAAHTFVQKLTAPREPAPPSPCREPLVASQPSEINGWAAAPEDRLLPVSAAQKDQASHGKRLARGGHQDCGPQGGRHSHKSVEPRVPEGLLFGREGTRRFSVCALI